MASTTTAKRFHHDLRSLADGYGVLCLIAERKASVMARHSGHGTRSVAPIPLNLGAWQLRQDITGSSNHWPRLSACATGTWTRSHCSRASCATSHDS